MSDHESDEPLISALADGELRGEEFSRALELLGRSERALAQWQSYHIVGAALRGEADCPGARDRRFLETLRARMDAPASRAIRLGQPTAAPAPATRADAANDAARPWRWAALVASLVAVTTLGWSVLQIDPSSGADIQLVRAAPAAAVQADATGVMVRDPRLDELMAAHRQFGGNSALQMPSGFLRNATFEPGAGQGSR